MKEIKHISTISFNQNLALSLGVFLIGVFLCMAIFADSIAPRDPLRTSNASLQPPSREFPFGSDDLGRDIFAGVVHGAKTSISIGVAVALISSLVGLIVGLIAGYFGGISDNLLTRMTELFLTPPRFFLALIMTAIFGSSFTNLILILSLTFWPVTARIIRAETMSIKKRGFVEATRALGAGNIWILQRTVLPHLLPLLITTTVVKIGRVIMVEAGLEFLGLGDQSRISWGYMLHNGQHFMRDGWWIVVFPLAAISLLLIALNIIGDELNRLLDPRS